jgi:hypothetical protein
MFRAILSRMNTVRAADTNPVLFIARLRPYLRTREVKSAFFRQGSSECEGIASAYVPDGTMSVNYTQNIVAAAGPKTMSSSEFRLLSDFVFDTCRIKMPPAKKGMLEGRLQKRLRILGVGSYGEYCNYLFNSPERECEYPHMIDCVTTNKTDFFWRTCSLSFFDRHAASRVCACCRSRR